ncbi:MAG: hypothetical protein JRH01_00340 [Deltaproteobacteria bacterium]|nr:hypothetical protein [Deltaproteobacteria bacterium]MBW2395209.1 hypothetical protein [Deltaproteobacteria bacterium]
MKYVLIVVVALLVLVAGYAVYMARVANPSAERELREEPDGERARKVMLITLPSGQTLPVNYLREGDTIYAAADGRWWHQLRGQGAPVELLVRGETLMGQARAIEDDPDHRSAVFDRLRPSAPKFFGTLVQIDLAPFVSESRNLLHQDP